MILQSLAQYHARVSFDPDSDIPKFGYSREKISGVLVLDRQGNLVDVMDIRVPERGKLFPRLLVVPKVLEGKRTSKIISNFLWDKTDYILGVTAEGQEKPEHFARFRDLHHEIGDSSPDEGLAAVIRFLDSWEIGNATRQEWWNDLAGKNFTFKMDGDLEFIHERPAVRDAFEMYMVNQMEDGQVTAQCLITGEETGIARLHGGVKGLMKPASVPSMKAEHTLVGFNLDSFCSFDKAQNFNAPVGVKSAFSYVTALNWLLRYESRQKLLIADSTTLFWAERPSLMEEAFLSLFNTRKEDESETEDDTDTAVRLHGYLDAIRQGKFHQFEPERDVKFYVLGLAPNAARIAVRFWEVSTVSDIARKAHRHFNDMDIESDGRDTPQFPSIWHILRETAPQGDMKNVSPTLGSSLMRAILTGGNYPEGLLSAMLTRIRADGRITWYRMMAIKACLVRNRKREVSMSLDLSNTQSAYLLGRLFAALERSQEDALGKSTIRDRYFGSASATPCGVFPLLLRLNQHHVSKGKFGFRYMKTISEIIEGLPAEKFPPHFGLDDQGLFAIGYYHQRNSFFRKNESTPIAESME